MLRLPKLASHAFTACVIIGALGFSTFLAFHMSFLPNPTKISPSSNLLSGGNLSEAAKLALIDKDQDKIHDALAAKIRSLPLEELVEITVSFSRSIVPSDLDAIQLLGGIVIERYDVINALQVKCPRGSLAAIANLPGVEIVEGLAVAKSTLIESTRQIRARPFVWDRGYQGNSSQAIAILDTGIDPDHPDFAGKISYWEDFTSHVYGTAQDKDEHGTHVASIAAGSGDNSAGSTFWETWAYRMPDNIGYFYPHGFQIYTPSQLIVNLTWNNTVVSGTPTVYLAWENSTNWDYSSCPVFSNSPYSFEFPTILYPGSYNLSVIPSNADATNRSYVAAIRISAGLTGDNYAGHLSGVAPASKIVTLKVLDDTGTGSQADLTSALNWIHSNGKSYNITVVSMSLGFDTIVIAIDNLVNTLVNTDGFVVVCAAGNDGPSSGYIKSPGSANFSICVGAVNGADQVAYYSSNGAWGNNPTGKPDILAPGGSIATYGTNAPQNQILAADSGDEDSASDPDTVTDPRQTDPYPGYYQQMQGTSMACPHVAGVAQLLIQAWPGGWEWNPTDVLKLKQILCMSAVETNSGEDYDGNTQNPSLNRGSKDLVEGWGKLYAEAALNMTTDNLQFFNAYTFNFGSGASSLKNFAGRVYLQNGRNYNLTLKVPAGLDADLYLYMPSPTTSGDPLLANKSTSVTLGQDETILFNANATGYFYLAAKYISGSSGSSASLFLADSLSIDVQNPLPNSWFYDDAPVPFNITVQTLGGTMDECWYSLDGADNVTFSGNTSVAILRGIHSVIFYANTTTGDTAWTETITFYVRTTTPGDHLTLSVISPVNGTTYESARIDFNITFITDLGALDKCWYILDGGDPIFYSGNESISLSPGTYTVVFYANNTLGEEGQSEVITFTMGAEIDWVLVTILMGINLTLAIVFVVIASRRK